MNSLLLLLNSLSKSFFSIVIEVLNILYGLYHHEFHAGLLYWEIKFNTYFTSKFNFYHLPKYLGSQSGQDFSLEIALNQEYPIYKVRVHTLPFSLQNRPSGFKSNCLCAFTTSPFSRIILEMFWENNRNNIVFKLLLRSFSTTCWEVRAHTQ